jgi:hypothetical protein
MAGGKDPLPDERVRGEMTMKVLTLARTRGRVGGDVGRARRVVGRLTRLFFSYRPIGRRVRFVALVAALFPADNGEAIGC